MRLLKLLIAISAIIVFNISALAKVIAEEASNIVISAVQTGTTISATEEFIQLQNRSNTDIEVNGLRLEYRSASGTSWTVKAVAVGYMQPHEHYLFAVDGYMEDSGATTMSSGLAKTGGHIRLSSGEGEGLIVYDLVGWGSALEPEGAAASVPPDGSYLKRVIDDEGSAVDTNNNSLDFQYVKFVAPANEHNNDYVPDELLSDFNQNTDLLDSPDVSNDTPETEQDDVTEIVGLNEPAQIGVDTDSNEETALVENDIYLSELFVDPVSPQTDAENEFVEIYNPNAVAVNLNGYKIQTGNSYGYSYVFSDTIVQPYSYVVVTSKDSTLTLSNSGGKARIVSPSGEVMDETFYEKAPEGASWIKTETGWQWSNAVTVGAANIALSLNTEDNAPSKTVKNTTKKTTKPKAATSKTSAKNTKSKASNTEKDVYVEPEDQQTINPLSNGVLAIVASLALIYAVSEYRSDIRNYYAKFRSHRSNRRAIRAKA